MMREAFRKTEPRGLWGRAKRGEKEKKEKLGPAFYAGFSSERQLVCADCGKVTFCRVWDVGRFFCRMFKVVVDPFRRACVYFSMGGGWR